MDNLVKYALERYKAGGSNRYVCPKCGRKKCFTRYINVETGEYLAEDCGKCDHNASCGYHYPPREYFRDHPETGRTKEYHTEYIHGKPLAGMGVKKNIVPIPIVHNQKEFYPFNWAEKAVFRPCTFRTWFEYLPFDKSLIQQVLYEYFVGGTKHDVVIRGTNYGPAVVFWMIDEKLQVHDAKLMAYSSDGHRISGWGNSMRSICEKNHVGPQLTETDKVLFGLHLLPYYPDKTVCIVESEKTALICACKYPQHLWMATGGCGNLQPEKLQPLKERRLVVYPDSGEYEKWRMCMKRSGLYDYTVVDIMEQYEPNTDIADIILGEAKKAQRF